jgi:hypothetical protein
MMTLYVEDLESGKFSERDIQDYFCERLEAKGIPYSYEKRTATDHRADLVVKNTVVEFKKYLNVPKINEARGQAENYADAFGGKKIRLVGVTPRSQKSAAAALRLADAIEANSSRIRVIFVDRDPEWCPPKVSSSSLKVSEVPPSSIESILEHLVETLQQLISVIREPMTDR